VGFDAQGFDHGAAYRRQAGSRERRAAFVFAGIDDEVIGDFGLSGNGAASEEIDRFDHGFGTPRHTLLLASSFGHSSVFGPANLGVGETPPLEGEDIDAEVRADIVFYETPKGGAVFSVGSMGFAASLSHNDYDNNISRMIENVVTRFLDEAPFPPP
jgi:N,N-dimethylformamidase